MLLKGWDYASGADYGVNSYAKPTIFLHALRGLMGGDAFDRAFYGYASKFRFRHPTTGDAEECLAGALEPARAAEALDFARAMATTASPADFAILEASQRETEKGGGEWLWTVRVQRRGQVPLPAEVWAEDDAGEKVLLGTMAGPPEETTKSFRLRSRRQLRVARLGPAWLSSVDRNLSDNARLRSGLEDGRAAAAIAARTAVYVEEMVRSSVGLAR
jgi:hypothetical protein